MNRMLDVVASVAAIVVLGIPALAVAILVRSTSRGPALYWSDRVGRGGTLFRMPKFRTMRIDTPELATDRLGDPSRFLTPIGSMLRKTSVDEIPQLWSILRGDMSFVGPRPALHNQHELIRLRNEMGIHVLRPGLTGLAQVMGRDALDDRAKALVDAEYLRRRSLVLDFRIILLTAWKVARREGVLH
jgi:O-antigen biosynthesis protein WbqP